jgi:hypothetical protein
VLRADRGSSRNLHPSKLVNSNIQDRETHELFRSVIVGGLSLGGSHNHYIRLCKAFVAMCITNQRKFVPRARGHHIHHIPELKNSSSGRKSVHILSSWVRTIGLPMEALLSADERRGSRRFYELTYLENVGTCLEECRATRHST